MKDEDNLRNIEALAIVNNSIHGNNDGRIIFEDLVQDLFKKE